MNEGKYIVFSDGTCRMFPVTNLHLYMVGNKDAVSAGRFEIKEDGKIRCFGESTTLGIKSHPDDADILACSLV